MRAIYLKLDPDVFQAGADDMVGADRVAACVAWQAVRPSQLEEQLGTVSPCSPPTTCPA